jgi:hypothetical protein
LFRALRCEPLEPRHLLSGVTLITHGFNSDADGWVTAMAQAMGNRADALFDQSIYRLELTDPGHDQGNLQVTNSVLSGPAPGDTSTKDPEITLLLDWSDVAGTLLFGGYTRSTYDVAAAVAESFLAPNFLTGLAQPLAQLPFHLVGHSRGGSLVGELAHQLGSRGIWVDQVTTLDPHPVDGVDELLGMDFGDAPMVAWENVAFWDNYWRENSSSFDFNGESIANVHNLQLDDAILADGGYSYGHSDVHLWYYGTIDTSTDPLANNGDEDVPNDWYGGAHPARDSSGYYFSRIVGGWRPSDGLSDELGGAASRSAVTLSGPTWPNVLDLQVGGGEAVITMGDPLSVSLYHVDRDSGATITFSLDPDQNPFNGNQLTIGDEVQVGATTGPTLLDTSLSTAGVSAGEFYLLAEISDADGHTRTLYAESVITLLGSSATHDDIIGRVDSSGDWWVGRSDGTSFANEKVGSWSSGITWEHVLYGDFNGDGQEDIAGRDAATGRWYVSTSTSEGFVTTIWGIWSTNATWQDVTVGDFNGDGMDDITGRVGTSGQWWVAESTGTAFTNANWGRWSTAVSWLDVKVADFDGDGNSDIAGRVSTSGDWWVASSTGTAFANSKWSRWTTSVEWINVATGDFNGDGSMDLVGQVSHNGSWYVATSTGSAFTNAKWGQWSSAVDWVDVSIGDFNGDGLSDLIGRVVTSGKWYVATSNGSSFTNANWGRWSSAVAWLDVQVGDFDGDGNSDLAGRVATSGDWWVAKSDGDSFSSERWGRWSTAVGWVDVHAGNFGSDNGSNGGEAAAAAADLYWREIGRAGGDNDSVWSDVFESDIVDQLLPE